MKNYHTSSQTNINYIPQLDGLRGLAILLVITFHYFGSIKIFSLGWTGVDLFFVLSGYLITSRIFFLKKEKNFFSSFYTNRALRILPVYFATLLIFFTAINIISPNKNFEVFKYYHSNWWSFLLFFQNWTFISQMPVPDHLLHFWTLAVEEQFYLIWPIFLFIFLNSKRLYLIMMLVLVIVIIFRCTLYLQYPDLSDYQHYFYNTFCRMDSFIIGGMLFLLQQKRNLKKFEIYLFIPLIFLVAGLYFTNTKQANLFMSTLGYTFLAILFAGIINFITLNPESTLSRFFKFKWLKFTGKISYGLYIFHWIVLVTFQSKLNFLISTKMQFDDPVSYWLSLIVCLVISFIISVVSFYCFEFYFLKLKKRYPVLSKRELVM